MRRPIILARSALLASLRLCPNQPLDAERLLSPAAALTPRSYDTLSNLGTSYIQLGRFEDALGAYKEAAALRPNHISARPNLAAAYKPLRQYDQALAQLKPFAGGRDPAVHQEFAALSMLTGDFPAAVKSLRKAVASSPDPVSLRRKLADALQKAGEFREAARELGRVADSNADDAVMQADFASALAKAGEYDHAISVYRRVISLNPQDAVARAELGQLFKDRVPAWHFTMLADTTRYQLYDQAIRAAVHPGAVVLDIGTGSGLLAMMAARAGAAHVYACEAEPLIAEKAREIVAQNGFSDRITIIGKTSLALRVGVDLPAKADVLLSEIVDVELLGEGIIGTLDHALADLVADGAAIIPCHGGVHAMLVESEALYRQDRVHAVEGFDLAAFNEFSWFGRFTADLRSFPYKPLSEPKELFRFDFARRGIQAETRDVDFVALEPGTCHGLVAWFELGLDSARRISAAPAGSSHWKQIVYLLETPRQVAAKDIVAVTASHDRNHIYLTV